MNEKKLNILLINVHGLFRGHSLELGFDSDTGGQTKYVLEYATELSKQDDIGNIYILTRQIKDNRVSADYAKDVEIVSKNIKILRVKCGKPGYIKKEKLWNHLDRFADNSFKKIKQLKLDIDLIHSHYADAGYIAIELSNFLNIPFIHTGHSLGIPKQQKLQQTGMSDEKIEKVYNMSQRVETENEIIKKARFVIVSTNQEITGQYSLYSNYEKGNFKVVPPGVDLDRFFPYYYIEQPDLLDPVDYEKCLQARASIKNELSRFLSDPLKPLILAICRPETRKNIEGLIEAYGQDKELQCIANLAIFAGIRVDISDKDDAEKNTLTDMLLLMDKYDLYGKMAIPKKHEIEYEVPELYRYGASLKGVFVNPAFIEPFGLTLLEAAASGMPIIATNNGGPQDIIKNCKNGILVDVSQTKKISNAIKKIVVDPELWLKYSNNGITLSKKHYSWSTHCSNTIKLIKNNDIITISKEKNNDSLDSYITKFKFFLFTDIDNTLLGDDKYLKEFIDWYKARKDKVCFAVATGRNIEDATKVLQENNVPIPDIFVTSVGTEIYFYYNEELIFFKSWEGHIRRNWKPALIKDLLKSFPFLKLQLDLRKYKISYHFEGVSEKRINDIAELLDRNKCKYKMIVTENKLLDILPEKASKSNAIKYICNKWKINEKKVLTAGDSGNDYEMLKNFKYSIVVSNHQDELKDKPNLKYSSKNNAGAILDAIEKFNFKEYL